MKGTEDKNPHFGVPTFQQVPPSLRWEPANAACIKNSLNGEFKIHVHQPVYNDQPTLVKINDQNVNFQSNLVFHYFIMKQKYGHNTLVQF